MSAVTKVQKWLKGNKKHISAPIADHAAFFDLFNGVNKPLCTMGYIQFQWNCGTSALADVNIGTTVNIGGVVNIFFNAITDADINIVTDFNTCADVNIRALLISYSNEHY